MNLAGLPPLGLKPEREGRDPDRLARIAAMSCIICHEWSLEQRTPTEVHHCIHGRHSQRRAPDSMTIPLCAGHHRGAPGMVSVHGSPAAFKALFGPDVDWLPIINDMLAGERRE